MKIYTVHVNEHISDPNGTYCVYSSFDKAYMAVLHYINNNEEHMAFITNEYDMTCIETECGFYIIEPFELDEPMVQL